MRELEIFAPELFKDFSEIAFDNISFDLHNEYDCYSILFSKAHELILLFKSPDQEIKIVFKDAILNYMSSIMKGIKAEDIGTIDNIYRGRYEDNSGLHEVTDDLRHYYYIEFYSGYTIELFAKAVSFLIPCNLYILLKPFKFYRE